MKKIVCLVLTVLLLSVAVSFTACGDGEVDYTFSSLSAVMSKAEAMTSCRLETVTEVDILQGVRTELSASREAELAYILDSEGKIDKLQAEYSLLDGNDETTFSVYCADGLAYYDEEGRKHVAVPGESFYEVNELFLFFTEQEVEDYHAEDAGDGLVRVTFFVPWESVSEKANELYDQLAEVLQASGMTYTQDLTYRDIRAEFLVNTSTETLVSYSYTYEAKVTIAGTAVKITGTSTCKLLETANVQLTPPDLTLWD